MGKVKSVFNFVGKVWEKGEKGAKYGVEWVGDVGKVAKNSACKLEGFSVKGKKVLSRPLAEEKKAASFAKKHGDATFTNAAGKQQTRFSYSNGKVFDHKLGDSITPRMFPNRLATAKLELVDKVAKEAKVAKVEASKLTHEASKGTSGISKKAAFAEWVGKHPGSAIKLTAWGGLVPLFIYGKLSGEGMIRPLFGAVGGENGLINEVGEGVFGKKDYGNIKKTLDSLQGEVQDIYQSGKSTVGNVGDEIASLYYASKEKGGKGADELKELYHRLVDGTYQGNGLVDDGTGNYVDPTTEQYPQLGNSGDVSSMLKRLSDSVSGKQVNKLDIASLMLSAYFMFGRFGMMGKIASLVLGGTTLNKMNNRQSLSAEQVQQLREYQKLKQLQQASHSSQSQEAPTEMRSRGL